MANINISQILMKRGNTATAGNYIGPLGELVVDTGLQTIRVQDGVTPGGMAVLATLSGYTQLSGNIANLQTTTANISANLSAFQTYANTTTANLSANLSAFRTYANATFGTSNFGNANVASYLSTSSIVTDINANVTAANLQIANLWSNAGVQADTIAILTANAGVQSANIATLVANAGVQADAIVGANAAIVTANTALKGYVDTQLSTLTNGASTALDTLLEIGTALGNNANFSATMITWLGNVTANTTAANTAIDTLQANLGGYYTWANANVAGLYTSILGANTAWQANAGVQAAAITTLQGQVYANANVSSYLLGNITTGNIIPEGNVVQSLGNATHQWSSLYVSSQTIYIGGQSLGFNNGQLVLNGGAVGIYGNSNVSAYLNSEKITSANIGGYQTWANANVAGLSTSISNLQSNAGVQADAIASLQANITAANLAIAAASGTYSNTNVAAYLSASTTGNVGAGNLTVVNNFNSNIISANSFTYANGTSILAGIVGTYSNSNVSAYLSSQNITGANIGGLYNSITGANTVIQTLSANIGSYYVWANANVSGLYNSILGANAATVTANSALKSYTDNQITTANTALKGYVDAGNTAQSNQINSINANIGSYYVWANANVAGLSSQITGANATISALQANIGSYYVWANANVAGLQSSITSLRTTANANTAAYLAANISTNIGTTGNVYAGNVIVNGQPTTYGTVNPAFIVVGLASSVTGLASGQTIILDTVVGNTNSQLSYNSSTGVFTLTAGVTYDMSFTPSFITFSNTTTGFMCYDWVDATTNALLDTTGIGTGTGISSQDTTAQQDNATARVIYTPSTNQTVKLRVTNASGTVTLRGGIGTQAIIKPLNPTIAVQATATGTVSATVVANTSPVVTSTNGGSSTSPGLTILTLAIPTAGTWRLDAELRVSCPGTGYMGAAFYDNGTLIPGSEYWVAGGATNGSGAGGSQYGGFMSYNLTTTGARTVTLGIWANGSTVQCISSADGRTWAQATRMDSIFALNTLATMSTTGDVSVGGNLAVTGTLSGSGSGLTGVALKTTGSWTVTTGTGTYSITVPASGTYQIWVRGNITNGIIAYIATVVITNNNVPVVGAQYAWVYNGGGSPIDFTSIPNQFTGTGNTIVRSSTAPSATTNKFDFGISNTSGSSQTVYWGYVALG